MDTPIPVHSRPAQGDGSRSTGITARESYYERTSLNARYRRAAQTCGHFPNEAAALKRLYLATVALDPTGRDADAGRAR